MADSAFLSLAKAIEQLLKVDPPVAAVIDRDRTRAWPKECDSAVNVSLDKAQGQRAGTEGGPTDWGTLYKIECYARTTDTQRPSDAVDPILTATFQRLSGGAVALGLDLDVEDLFPDPRIEWDLGESAEKLACAAFSVRIVHRTKAADLAPWST